MCRLGALPILSLVARGGLGSRIGKRYALDGGHDSVAAGIV